MSSDALVGLAIVLIGISLVGHLIWHIWRMR
jgi:hypothetical protein